MLMFEERPVRIVMFDGVPFFSLEDICEAGGWKPFVAKEAERSSFPTHAKRTALEDGPEGSKEVTVLSPVGVWHFTELVDGKRGEKIAAWAKREARRLCPEPLQGDPAVFLTLMEDRTLPPRPSKYSGRLSEWRDLKDRGGYLTARAIAEAPYIAREQEIIDRLVAAREAQREAA